MTSQDIARRVYEARLRTDAILAASQAGAAQRQISRQARQPCAVGHARFCSAITTPAGGSCARIDCKD